jgi:hypothetical protein
MESLPGAGARVAPIDCSNNVDKGTVMGDRSAIAVVNTNPDLVRRLRVALEIAGFIVFELHVEDIKLGSANVQSFLQEHDPSVIVYDVAPPFDLNWRFLDHLRTTTDFSGRHFVLVSVNEKRAREIVGRDETVYEVVGEAEDIDAVVRAVKEASRARPTR